MKKSNGIILMLSVVLMAALLTGCITVEMKVNGNGSCELTYTIDSSGLVTKNEVEKTLKESIEKYNQRAGKKVAILKSMKENQDKGVLTAVISVTNLNDIGDGSFFGTVRHYRMKDGVGLDNLVDTKGRAVAGKDIPEDLYVVYTPGFEQETYGLLEVTIIVPGSIQYVTSGAEIQKSNTARFSGEIALVVFKKSGGGFPYWIVILAGAIFIIYYVMKRRPTVTPVISPPVTTQVPDSIADIPSDPMVGSTAVVPSAHRSSDEA